MLRQMAYAWQMLRVAIDIEEIEVANWDFYAKYLNGAKEQPPCRMSAPSTPSTVL